MKTVRSPRLQTERYSVILVTILVVTAWKRPTSSTAPIDRSMFGFGVPAFSSSISPCITSRCVCWTGCWAASFRQPDAMYFFDPNQRCIWMNEAGAKLLHMEETDLACVKECPGENVQ